MNHLSNPTAEEAVPNSPEGRENEVQCWMALQIAARIRRARTRRALHCVTGRDLDRMGLTRFEVESRMVM